jgi:hypothetical protein
VDAREGTVQFGVGFPRGEVEVPAAFLGIAGLLIAPVAHRLLHSLHVDEEGEE